MGAVLEPNKVARMHRRSNWKGGAGVCRKPERQPAVGKENRRGRRAGTALLKNFCMA
jgi:hypothetical protein